MIVIVCPKGFDSPGNWMKVTKTCPMLSRKPEGPCIFIAQEEAGETSKKPVGPCILSPRGGYPRDIEGHRGSLF